MEKAVECQVGDSSNQVSVRLAGSWQLNSTARVSTLTDIRYPHLRPARKIVDSLIADRFVLECQQQTKLNLPRIDYRGANDAVAQCAHAQPGVGEDRMVRDVEELASKLQVRALAELEPLEHGEVPVDDARTDDRVPSGDGVAELRAARQPVHKRRKVE